MNKKKKGGKSVGDKKFPEDSMSDISDLEKEDILTRYYEAVMTQSEKVRAERKKTQARLYSQEHVCAKKNCSLHKKRKPGSPQEKVKV